MQEALPKYGAHTGNRPKIRTLWLRIIAAHRRPCGPGAEDRRLHVRARAPICVDALCADPEGWPVHTSTSTSTSTSISTSTGTSTVLGCSGSASAYESERPSVGPKASRRRSRGSINASDGFWDLLFLGLLDITDAGHRCLDANVRAVCRTWGLGGERRLLHTLKTWNVGCADSMSGQGLSDDVRLRACVGPPRSMRVCTAMSAPSGSCANSIRERCSE